MFEARLAPLAPVGVSRLGTLAKRVAILEFDNTERVNAWLGSPEYIALDESRTKSSNINMVVVEGL